MADAPTRIFLRALTLDAFVGVYAHERARSQKLVIDVELFLNVIRFETGVLAETVDYDLIAAHARALAADHIDLIETYAERLADKVLEDNRVVSVRVKIEKPDAVPAAIAGVELIRCRPLADSSG